MFNLLKKLLILFVLICSTGFSIYREHVTPPSATSYSNTEEYNSPSSNFAPTFTNCPADINNVSPNSGDCTAVVTWTPPTATGSGTVTMTSNYTPGDAFYPGVHRVIYRATDSSGDTSFCEFKVEVLDNQAPIITVPANITTTADPGSCGAIINFPFPNATDNCPAGEGAPIDENFDSPDDLSSECYDFDGTIIGSAGAINGSSGEVETVELIRNDIRSFTSPLTQFNGTGEIFFDHRILSGHSSGNLGTNSRLSVKLITAGGAETIIFTEQYVDEAVQTEYISITQSGNYFVQFEWETDQNRSDIAYLDNLYIPGYVVSDVTVVACTAAFLRVAQISGQPYRSGREFPVGTTTLEYITRDAADNVGFNSFKVTVTNNITPPSGSDVEYCEGTPVPTLTVGVSSGQTVDWYDAAVGGTLLLANSTSYQPSGPGDYYAETKELATGCVSATRRRIRLTENPQPSAPVSPSPIEYCVNDAATPLTATGDPGNMIFWYDAPTGGSMYPNPPTPDTSFAQTTFYYVEQTDAGTGCISERTEVVVRVYALPLAPMVNTPVEYCIGDTSDELNASVTNGSNLRWYNAASGGSEIPGITRPDTSTSGQQLFWVTQSAASGSVNCESPRTQLTVNVNTRPVITMQPVDRSICENENANFSVVASDADTFQWQLFDGSNWNDLTNTETYSGATSNTLNISNVTLALNGNQYRALASSPAASCPDAISTSAILTVNMAPPIPTSGGDQTECEQNPIQTLTATANPPSGSTIVWYDAPSGGNSVANPILEVVGTVTYYAESNNASNSCSSAGRIPVTLTIQPVPAAPTSGGDQVECEESPIQTLTASATAGSGATVVWYDAASGGNLIADPSLNSVGTVIYYAQSNDDVTGCPSASRTSVSLTIQPSPAPPISDGDQTECEMSPIQTLTANATVPAGFTITWFDAATGGANVGSPTLNSVGSVTYFAESTDDVNACKSTTRTPVTLTIDATPSAPISDGDQTECEASPTQTMIATAVAPAGSTVTWYDMPSGGTVVSSPELNSAGTITYYAESQTAASGCISDSRTPVTLTMNSRPNISVTPASAFCSADLMTYSVSVDVDRGSVTASEGTVIDNGGNNWTVSNIPSGNDIVITVTDSNVCSETLSISAPDCGCPVVMTPTSGGNITECEQNPIQTLTATATAPAGASVVWYDSPTNGTSITNPILNNVGTTTYYAESVDDVNGCTSSTRTPVNLTIQAAPNAPISGGDQTECQTTPTQTLTATASSAAGTSISWYDAAIDGNIVTNPILNTLGTVTYYAEATNDATNCTSHSRTAVSLTILANPTAPISGGDQEQCESNPIQTLTAMATAPSGSIVVWYDAASGGNLISNPDLSTVGTVTYYAESQDTTTNCLSTSRTLVNLTILDTPDISQTPSSATCSADLMTYSVSVDASTGSIAASEGTIIDNGGNNWTISNIPAGNDITVTVTATNACTRTLMVTAPDCSCTEVDAPTNGNDQTVCEESPIQTLTATATPPTDSDIVWYDAATGGNVVTGPTLNSVGTITYFAESRDIVTNCTSSTRTPVQLTINGTPADPTPLGNQIECEANPIQTLTAMAASPSGTSIVWYDAEFGGNVVANPILNAVGTVTYFAESRDDVTNCSSFGRAAVALTINALPNVTANATQTNINAGEPVTLTGSGADSYVWDNGVIDGDTVFPLTTTTYSVIGTDANGCENSDSITVIVGSTSDIRLEKTVNDPTPNVGDTIVFTLTVTNDGPSDDSGGSIVNDILPVGYTYVANTGNTANGTYDSDSGNWTLPALTNGSSASITITTTVNPPTGTSNEYMNRAQVVSAGNFDSDSTPNNDDGDQSEDDEASVTVVPQMADLEVNNTISENTGNPGDVVTFTVDITNNGPNDATNVCVENSVPEGFIVNTIQNGGIQTGNTIIWTGLDIATGSTITVTFEVSVNNPNNSPDEYLNTVQIISVDQFDSDSTPNNDDGDQSEDDEDNVLFMLQSIDLELTNTVTPDSGNPGDRLTFMVDVRNTGMNDATNVNIENIVPSGYTVSTIHDGGIQSGNTIAWNGLTIPSGTTISLTFEVIINVPNNTTGEFINTVQVTDADQLDSDSSPNNDDGDQSEDDEDSAAIVLIPADLSLEKAITSSSNQNPNAGDTITFQLILTNTGPGIATNVTVEDIVPSGYTIGTIGNGGLMNGNMIVWNLPSIDVGSEVLTYDATVNLPANIIGEYTNTAQITTSDQFDPDSTPNNDDGNQNEDDEANYTIGSPTVDIEINKTVDKAQTFNGDTLIFTVNATNNSAYDATTVGIEDVLPRGYTLVSHNADLGTYNETIATWEIPIISVGQTASLQMTVNVTETEEYTNIAELIYLDQIDTNTNNDRAEVTPQVTPAECLTVFNEFSPNDDGANDFFFIECIENYPNSLLRIYNRWGNEVFSAVGYDNSWDGTTVNGATIGAAGKLPVGTYYYTLEPGEGNANAKSGWLYISR